MGKYDLVKEKSLKKYNMLENNYIKRNIIKCKKCGHTLTFLKSHSKICSFCGNIVYPNDKCEFKERLEKEIRKVK